MNYFPIQDLKRADYNPRKIPSDEMEALMKAIETHGFIEPIVVNVHKDRYGIIVGGHQRLTAVEKLLKKGIVPRGLLFPMSEKTEKETGYEIPCFTVELDLEAEKVANIGLNRIHGKFDEEKLFDLIFDLKDSPVVATSGLSSDELTSILDYGTPKKKVTAVKEVCTRCEELKLQVIGHFRASRHPIRLVDDNDKK